MTLELELDTYRANLPGLLDRAGQFVLIHGRDVVGVYGSRDEALEAGYERWPAEAFLVKRIEAAEKFVVVNRFTPPCPY